MSFILDLENSNMSTSLVKNLIKKGFKEIHPTIKTFKDGETFVEFEECIRGNDVYLVCSTAKPVNDNLMKVLITADAVRRASAKSITLVAPYLGYSRQDRKVGPHQPITAKLVADMIQASGINRVITCDLHAMQIQGFYTIPLDNASMIPAAAQFFKKKNNNYLVISPDHGGVARARLFADILGTDIAIIDKQRKVANEVASMNIIGDVNGKDCLIVDDMVDTGNTLMKAATELKRHGAKSVSVFCTHGVLSDGAEERLFNCDIDKMYISDTISNDNSKFLKVSCVPMLTKVVLAIDRNESIWKVIHAEDFDD